MISYSQKLDLLRRTPSCSQQVPMKGRTRVLELLAATLGVTEQSISETRPFSDLGLNSLLGVRFLDAINRAHGLKLGVEVLFAQSSPAALSAYIDKLAGLSFTPDTCQPEPKTGPAGDEIAIIGMAGRFPGAADVSAFWELLAEGACAIREVPPERWSAGTFYSSGSCPGKTISKWGGFLDGIDQFDASFFNISPLEAAAMDPQHRLFLEQAWLAFENAGYPAEKLKGSATGIFAGASGAGYEAILDPDTKAAQTYGLTGNLGSLLAARIAYHLDLRGPALSVDTACSASLVAFDLACQALRQGEITMALVGGVNLFLDEKPFISMTRTGMLSPEGRCYPFDARANGIAVGEAAAAVVLKPLAQAQADGDRIDAVVRGSGTNQDGRSNGVTAPNPEAQTALLRKVHKCAGIHPSAITYVEAHGTGTPLGDPVEVAALREALGSRGADTVPCALGSVKGNIGHTAEAAGLAGLIKTVLCLRHKELVPSPGFTGLNPKISFGDSGLYVAAARKPWSSAQGMPRLATVSAFGLSGTNAHVVLEEAPSQPLTITSGPGLLLLSAVDAECLERAANALAEWLRGPGATHSIAAVAATLALRRNHFRYRLACIAGSPAEAAEILSSKSYRTSFVAPGAEPPPDYKGGGGDAEVRAAIYLNGAAPNWPELWPGVFCPLDLPGYPFRSTGYWAGRRPAAAITHPFADLNETDRVAHVFTSADPVARDHQVGGVAILHAAVFLEMARFAAARHSGQSVTALCDIAWDRKVIVQENGTSVSIDVAPADTGLYCRMSAGAANSPAARCRAVFDPQASPPALDIAEIIGSTDRHVDRRALDSLDRGTVRLGQSFPGFDELWLGRGWALSFIGPAAEVEVCLLPPRLIDAAIQTGAALLAQDDGPALRLRYPAAVAAIQIFGSVPAHGCYIYARAGGPLRVDLTISDVSGVPLIHWNAFEMRTALPHLSAAEVSGPKTYQSAWIEYVIEAKTASMPNAIVGAASFADAFTAGVQAASVFSHQQEDLERLVSGIGANAEILFGDQAAGNVEGLFRLVKLLAARGLSRVPLTLRVVTINTYRVSRQESEIRPEGATLHGLAKAAGREFPAWRVVLFDIDTPSLSPALRDQILAAQPCASGEPIAYRNGLWYERVLTPLELLPEGKALRQGGVYLIVGGMGRVGREIAHYIASHYAARLLLVGRQPLDAERQAFLDTLCNIGAEANYHSIDITAPGALGPALASMKARSGKIDGVIQAVVDPLFARISQTDSDAFIAALAPKIAGLRELARATETENLDFFAIFSSIGAYAAFPGNVGQASYCAACCFEEAFAAKLQAEGRPARLIQWGLWENAAFEGEGLARLRRQGAYPMQTAEAILAFEHILISPSLNAIHASLSEPVWQAMGAIPAPPHAFSAAHAAMKAHAAAAEPADVSLHQAVDAYARALAAETLGESGLIPIGLQSSSREERYKQAEILPRHGRLFDAVLALVKREDGTRPERKSLLARASSLRKPLELLELCIAALPRVLRGECEGTDVLFPNGTMGFVEAIYRDQPVLAACNAMLASAAAASRPARILELGAGTGATSREVLKILDGANFEYHFTDISPSFVRQARAQIKDPRLRFAVLDIEKDPAPQGFAASSFDLVLATNVLHATRDILETLRHAASLTRPGGLTLINEMTIAEDFATLTFGLLDGWWRATDQALRLPHSPLLDAGRWRSVLRAAGFAHIAAVPAPGFADLENCPQTLFLAAKIGDGPLPIDLSSASSRETKAHTSFVAYPPRIDRPASLPFSEIEDFIRCKVAESLELAIEAVDPETPFGEVGVDSIVAPMIAEAINHTANIDLRTTDLYNFATARALARHIESHFPHVGFKRASSAPAVAEPQGPHVVVLPARVEKSDDAMAIIGMAGRFPDAPDLGAFWRNILAGKSAVREISRFDLNPYFSSQRGATGKTYTKWAATLSDHDCFDPLFFTISPAEAEAMDPQQRLLLEEAWHALEDAGMTPQQLDGARCGVFVGASANSYVAPTTPSLQTLGGSMAILSARLAYFLNLKGPALPVDTGCSSSLVALHLACQSLRQGETDIALAAGVSCNLLSPPIFLYLSDAGMASPVGQCKTFDNAADGFVPGEGIGVVALKRLADAQRDGDRIHAVVRATGVNQDGKTSGLTAPSATSQTELECAVYRQAGISPDTIRLVEAHGTGTRLGDPIEVSALTDAFAAFTPAKGFCAIGSVKTNIGHAMAASGMAGLLKAVQALRHRVLPPSLNYSTPNRHIDFANSPFFVNTHTLPWPGEGLRRAAVSSFGFSGTNAHAVIEEAPATLPREAGAGPFIFTVSAKTEAALARRIDDLRRWLKAEGSGVAPGDIAYTLAMRRAHFRFRQAYIAGSMDELIAVMEGEPLVPVSSALERLAQRYLAGETVDFSFMEGMIADLPLYPFEKERCWKPEEALTSAQLQPEAQLPLLGRLASHWLTKDHVVEGHKLLPGAVFLEFARARVLGSQAACSISGVTWAVPVDATGSQLSLTLEIESTGAATRCLLQAGAIVHAKGVVASLEKQPAPFDLAAAAARCPVRLEGAAIYQLASQHGFVYGAGYQVIEHVVLGSGEALAHLALPAVLDDGFVLHPALLDGAFQTAACIGQNSAAESPAHSSYVPFALDRFEAYAPLRDACLAHARLANSNTALLSFDITICAADGTILAKAAGLRARPHSAPVKMETLFYSPVWRPCPAPRVEAVPTGPVLAFVSAPDVKLLRAGLPGRRVIEVRAGAAFARLKDDIFEIDPLRPEDYQRLLKEAGLETGAVIAHLWALGMEPLAGDAPSLSSAIAAVDSNLGLRSNFFLARAVLQAPEVQIGRLVLVSPPGPAASAAAAFVRSLALETSRFACAAIEMEPESIAALAGELGGPGGSTVIAFHDGRRVEPILAPWTPSMTGVTPGCDDVTVITGGAGALGLCIARHLAQKDYKRLVLIGRSSLDSGRKAALGTIEAAGADVLYLRADVTSGSALRAALSEARRRFGPITGVIHAAGLLRDGLMTGQADDSFDAVTAPKILGALALDHLTRDDPLTFFLMFSSTAATFGSAGQAAYAAANGFLEGFAAWRRAEGRPGRTLAVAWPMWSSTGMTPPAEVAAELRRKMGLVPMPEAEALAAFDQMLAANEPHIAVLHGQAAALRAFVVGDDVHVAQLPAVAGQASLLTRVEAYLKSLVADVTKLAVSRIDSGEPFEAYGIDSMMIVRMNTRIEHEIGDLPKTLFFEHRTIGSLAAHLAGVHSDVLAARFCAQSGAAEKSGISTPPIAINQSKPEPADDSAIAIIGLAGIYPMASNLDEFWRNLTSGRDCIVEIPPERWPLEGFYDPDRDRAGTSYSKWGGFIEGADLFDARFFNISPREADALDPQARKFLEVAFAAMEDAGLTRDTLFRGDPEPELRRAGVFAGVMYGDYQLFGPEEAARGNLIAPNAAYWNVANRISHFLDLQGPSIAVDTACSSSLSAIHLACAAIRNGDCTIAFAGGVNLTIHPSKHWILSKSGFASSDGRCRSFGDGGDGYVPGEGVGVVLLKQLGKALTDGDSIHAVIRASAVNHGGHTNGYTVPNPVAQGRLIKAAMRRGGIAPDSIGYIEAHGTGTALGDPVEIAGLSRAFTGLAASTVAVGSVKSNIGHLESAAGIAALTKVVLQLKHKELVPSLHAETLNPNLDLAKTPFFVQRKHEAWEQKDNIPRRAGVSSFGAGGANAHLIIEEAPALPTETAHDGGVLIAPLSAATGEALRQRAHQLAAWLAEPGRNVDFAALVRTLQTGREAMKHRLALAASSLLELTTQLQVFADGSAVAHNTDAMASAFMAGENVDWDLAAPGPRRPVSLPAYPFERRRCWVQLSGKERGVAAGTSAKAAAITGLSQAIACNSADPLVSGHRFGGEIVLAGAFLLDAARRGAEEMLGKPPLAAAGIRFLRPVKPGMSPRLTIEEDGNFIISTAGSPHASGRFLLDANVACEAPLDLAAIRSRCADVINRTAIYAGLAAAGAQYGPAYRLLETVWRGKDEALAQIAGIPATTGWPANLIDAMFQITFALASGQSGFVPFTIDRIEAMGPLESAAHVYALRRESGPGFIRLDLRLCDALGTVLMIADGLVARAVPDGLPLRLLRPVWLAASPIASEASGAVCIIGEGGLAEELCAAWPHQRAELAAIPLENNINAASVWVITKASAAGTEADAIVKLAQIIKTLAAQASPPQVTIITFGANRVLPDEIPNPAAAALAAFAKSAGHEYPRIRLRVIDADASITPQVLLAWPAEEGELAWRQGAYLAKHFTETPLSKAQGPWRFGGTYVIAGGAGGIGLALATHIVRNASAQVIILGRRAIDAELSNQIKRIGETVVYLQADVSDATALKVAVSQITARFGAIHGAFNLALVMHDARIATLSETQIRMVLAPKINGTYNLMAALRDIKLDFLMLFSSSNAHTANPGQSAYAAASAAQDAIGLLPAPWPVKIADWGFWGEAGSVATPDYHSSLARIGVFPIATEEGFAVMEQFLASPFPQIMPLRISEAVAKALGVEPVSAAEAAARDVAETAWAGSEMLKEAANAFKDIDAYAASLVLLAFQSMGFMRASGGKIGLDFQISAGIEPRFERLLAALLDILQRAGFLSREEDGWCLTGKVEEPELSRRRSLESRRAGWIEVQPHVAAYLNLLDTCCESLPEVLRGRVEPNEVLFPGGAMSLVEPIYRGNAVVDHFQTIAAAAVTAAAEEMIKTLETGSRIRILEIGAGTGGTTAFVLPPLSCYAAHIDYVFTDIGDVFLKAARARFADYPFLKFAHLDIERSPSAQGFAANGFDIVIAANVLHATRNMDKTMSNVASLCRAGGLMLLNEATAQQDFNTLTFGLTRGWWMFEDHERRLPHSPLLASRAWQVLLASHGFLDIQVLSGGDGALQSVIAAVAGRAAQFAIPEYLSANESAPRLPAGNASLEALLRDTVAKSLRLAPDEVDADTSFSDYGADSIISVELVRDINAALGIELKTTALFNYSTIRTLAAHIASEFPAYSSAAEQSLPKPESGTKARSDRLRDMIRRSRDAMGFEAPAAPPSQNESPPAKVKGMLPPECAAGDEAFFALLKRVEAREIGISEALAEIEYD